MFPSMVSYKTWWDFFRFFPQIIGIEVRIFRDPFRIIFDVVFDLLNNIIFEIGSHNAESYINVNFLCTWFQKFDWAKFSIDEA